jgi:hypothetical protein
MRFLFTLIILGALGYGGYWTYNNVPQVRDAVDHLWSKIDHSQVQTLQLRYDAEQLARSGDSELQLHPYLMIDSKYTDASGETMEGTLLWDLTDGELILNASTWEKTHGVQDCLQVRATPNDCRILRGLTDLGSRASRADLASHLHLDGRTLQRHLTAAAKRSLVTFQNDQWRIHIATPHLAFIPETATSRPLATQPMGGHIQPKRYSTRRVESLAQSLFGESFAIRQTTLVYLPVYSVSKKGSDGALGYTSYNALTGAQL